MILAQGLNKIAIFSHVIFRTKKRPFYKTSHAAIETTTTKQNKRTSSKLFILKQKRFLKFIFMMFWKKEKF